MDEVVTNDPERKCKAGRVVKVGWDGDGEYFLRIFRGNGGDQEVYDYVALRTIFEQSANGTLKDNFPDLKERDIRLCEAFAATNLDNHPLYKKNFRSKKVSILFDENLPYGLVPELSQVLPNLSHVYLEGMGGYMDDFLFNRPWFALKDEKPSDMKRKRQTKHIIISRDSDLTDLARDQWIRRIQVVAHPDKIMFDDVNVVFHVTDTGMTRLEHADHYKEYARDIMKAAYSCEAASYVLDKDGVRPEPGSSFPELLRVVDEFHRVSGQDRRVRLREISELPDRVRLNMKQHFKVLEGGVPRNVGLMVA